VHNARLHCGQRKDRADRLRKSLEPVDDGNQDVGDAASFEFVHHLEPKLGALGLLDPQPEHLFFALDVKGERDIDGFVADQTFVANLDPQRVKENHWVDRIERPALPFPHLLEHGIGDPADQIGGNFHVVQLLQMRLDLADRETPGIEADDPVVETVEPGLTPSLRWGRLFATSCGSKLPLRSRGTAISMAPSSPITVLLEKPFRLLPLPPPAGSPFS